MRPEVLITEFQNESISVHGKFYPTLDTGMRTFYKGIKGEQPVKLGITTHVVCGGYSSNFNIVQNVSEDRIEIKKTSRFQLLNESLKKDSESIIEFLQEVIKQPKIELIELDADEYGEAKIIVYLKQRMEPRDEVRLVRKVLREIRKRSPNAKVHVIIDYSDRASDI